MGDGDLSDAQLKALWDSVDKDRSGTLSRKEIAQLLENLAAVAKPKVKAKAKAQGKGKGGFMESSEEEEESSDGFPDSRRNPTQGGTESEEDSEDPPPVQPKRASVGPSAKPKPKPKQRPETPSESEYTETDPDASDTEDSRDATARPKAAPAAAKPMTRPRRESQDGAAPVASGGRNLHLLESDESGSGSLTGSSESLPKAKAKVKEKVKSKAKPKPKVKSKAAPAAPKKAAAPVISTERMTENQMDRLWNLFDKDNSGELDHREIRQLILKIKERDGVKEELPETFFQQVTEVLDPNGDGKVSKFEFDTNWNEIWTNRKLFYEKVGVVASDGSKSRGSSEGGAVETGELERLEERELQLLWRKFDEDNSGTLEESGDGNEVSEAYVQRVFGALDPQDRGQIAFLDFKLDFPGLWEGREKLLGNDQAEALLAAEENGDREIAPLTKEELERVWNSFSGDDGMMDKRDVRMMLHHIQQRDEMTEPIDEETCRDVFSLLDGDGDGLVSHVEFLQSFNEFWTNRKERVEAPRQIVRTEALDEFQLGKLWLAFCSPGENRHMTFEDFFLLVESIWQREVDQKRSLSEVFVDEVFEEIDEDRSGLIEWSEFRLKFNNFWQTRTRRFDFEVLPVPSPLNQAAIGKIFFALDSRGDEMLTVDEMRAMIEKFRALAALDEEAPSPGPPPTFVNVLPIPQPRLGARRVREMLDFCAGSPLALYAPPRTGKEGCAGLPPTTVIGVRWEAGKKKMVSAETSEELEKLRQFNPPFWHPRGALDRFPEVPPVPSLVLPVEQGHLLPRGGMWVYHPGIENCQPLWSIGPPDLEVPP
uniref:EF-hand domain-containing protein n=1 Tax=Chromera velia CCMP2878 TaxID=1169474 RepID=A0A0G4HGQ4_9ALVE|eukprot:Cvel_27397.t1-p1 / transcript=Cvel_27397.t1 / gene=Cvel_27397 / organism=Chromera_velia_CCMP2878 / gene_product=hypothetical protein / transcript_product=hypothetical protein / location=Cvel_scaffold3414:368-13540(+) / protein_length=822 / sequence_SO=supercontig / SO=protein_coding / is_pseudo=false